MGKLRIEFTSLRGKSTSPGLLETTFFAHYWNIVSRLKTGPNIIFRRPIEIITLSANQPSNDWALFVH